MTRQLSSGRRMRESGRRVSQVWLTSEEYEAIRQAAAIERRPMTQILVLGGLALAEKIRKKSKKSA